MLRAKSADACPLREMVSLIAERLMELDIAGKTGTGYGEKGNHRLAQHMVYLT